MAEFGDLERAEAPSVAGLGRASSLPLWSLAMEERLRVEERERGFVWS